MERREEDETSKQVDLACTVCNGELVIPMRVYGADSSVVPGRGAAGRIPCRWA